jgi:hypothetical protein
MQSYAELCFGISTEVLLDKSWSRTVKSCGHRCMCGKEITGPRRGHCYIERAPGLFHETPSAFQNGKRSMTLIQMTDLGTEPKRAEQLASADAQQQFLLEAQLRSTAIQFARNTSMSREVCCVIAV